MTGIAGLLRLRDQVQIGVFSFGAHSIKTVDGASSAQQKGSAENQCHRPFLPHKLPVGTVHLIDMMQCVQHSGRILETFVRVFFHRPHNNGKHGVADCRFQFGERRHLLDSRFRAFSGNSKVQRRTNSIDIGIFRNLYVWLQPISLRFDITPP